MPPENVTWNAADYAKQSSAQLKWAEDLIAKLDLREHESALDIGCGNGRVTAKLASLMPHGNVTGIDNSPDMVQLAESTYPPFVFTNLVFMLMDARELNFKNKFDIVFSNATLHWIKDHGPVLAGIYRSLKKGGRYLLQMGGKGNASDMLKTVEKVMAKKNWQKFFKDFEFPYGFYEPDEYAKLVTDAGLFVDRITLIPKNMSHNNKNKLTGWFRTTWLPYTERVPVDGREKFINEVIISYLHDNPADRDGRTHVGMVRLEVEGRKLQ